MRNFYLTAVSFFVLAFALFAGDAPRIKVIYPKRGQTIAAVDSMFIFGNVTPKSSLTINGRNIRVYKNGAFIAFLPVILPEFSFRLKAIRKGDTSTLEIPVELPEPYITSASDSIVISERYMLPKQDIGLQVGDFLELSFRGSPELFAYFRLSTRLQLQPMIETPPRNQNYWGEDLFGKGAMPDSLTARGIYGSVITLTHNDITDTAKVYYYLCRRRLLWADSADSSFEDSLLACGCELVENERALTVFDDREILIGELVDSTQTIRTGPRKGYLSIFQPKGVKFRLTGFYGNYLRAQLVPDQYAWIPDSSIKILPGGTQLPRGEVVLVRTQKTEDGAIVSFSAGAKLPFRVEEDLSQNRIILEVYNCTSNIDWIRYDNADDLIKEIHWSQPQAEVLRLVIDLDGSVWGYDTWYEGNRFNLGIRQAPELKWRLKNLRIVIDAGHSPDPGSIGPTGLREKDANLAIALQLAKVLRKKKAKVFLTRSDDSPLSLYDRPKLAYKYKADIFISIHNNALPDGVNPFYNNGISTYYYHPHSKPLADRIQNRLIRKTGYQDFGTYHANFAVLRPTGYLAVLVETAFMILPEHEMALRKESFQKRVAEAITSGLLDFIRSERKNQR